MDVVPVGSIKTPGIGNIRQEQRPGWGVSDCAALARRVGQVWSLVKTLMPARTVAKVSLFRADRPEEFKAELLQRVDLSQIPDWLGGHATGWAHGEGGSDAVVCAIQPSKRRVGAARSLHDDGLLL